MDFFLSDIPATAYSPFEWPEYNLSLAYPAFVHAKNIGTNPHGVRIGVWPIYIDEYRSDTEPTPQKGPVQLVQWHRLTRTDTPPGWWQLPHAQPELYIGIYNDLRPGYTNNWKKTAAYYSRQVKKRLLDQEYRIESLDFNIFAEAFAHSTVAREIPTLEIRKLQKRLELFPQSISMWGMRRISDNKIVAGFSAFDSAHNKASQYGCSFYLPEVYRDNLVVGLIDHWFEVSIHKQIRVLHFGLFAPKGQGTGRAKTISDFKSKFITHHIAYQPPLWRLTGGKLF